MDIPVRCSCGRFEGVARDVTPKAGNHPTCYCDDCQSFQHFLGQADRVLNENGGTTIFQMSPGRIRITSGAEYLACMSLKPGGLVRWYASCCNTPFANTLGSPALPFAGVITVCFPEGDQAVASALGPVKGGVHGRFAIGDRSKLDAHDKAPVSLVFGFIGKMIRWRLRGDHKKGPFFDPDTGNLRVTPKVLDEAERQEVERRRESFSVADG